jgi:perosamine synthetase
LRPAKTIPPAAAPVSVGDLFRGATGLFRQDGPDIIADGIRNHFGSESVFLVSSGKTALLLILKGLHAIRPRRKVLIPAYTCYSVPSAIRRAGLEIVLCDVDPETLDFNYAQLERLADDGTLCVVSTHLFGIPSDVERARRICEAKGIYLVEDAAQAMGVPHRGRFLGTFGDTGFFSLGRGKNITCGNGGIILTSSAEISASIMSRLHELRPEPLAVMIRGMAEAALTKVFLNPFLYWLPRGLPFLGIGETTFAPAFPTFRLGRFGAGVLRSWKERLEAHNGYRAKNGRHYAEALGLRDGLSIHCRPTPYLRFPVYAKTPEAKIEACDRLGSLGVSPMYPDSVNRIKDLRRYFGESRYPGAEWIAGRLMTLPTHAILSAGDLDRICAVITAYCETNAPKEPAICRKS